MRISRLLLCSAALLAACSSLSADEPLPPVPSEAAPAKMPSLAWYIQYSDAAKAMAAENRPMLIYVKMDACSYCVRMEQETYGNSQVAQDVAAAYVPAMINRRDDPTLVRRLGVTIFPTTVIVGQDGKVLDTIPGYVAPEQFRARLGRTQVARK